MALNRDPEGLERTLGTVGEFPLLAGLLPDLPTHPDVVLGPGDDAAAVSFFNPALISTDILVEGVHFRRDWSSAEQIGRKAAAVNMSDIEAMGAKPKAMVVAFAAPSGLEASWARECLAGIAEEAARCEVAIVGGDLSSSEVVTIGVTVFGESELPPVTRSGARPGQVVAIVGRLGWAAGGLHVLQRGFSAPRDLVAAHQVPTPPYGQGQIAAASGATALIDISDGLLADLGHVAEASRVSIDINPDCFDIPESMERLSAATGVDPMDLILTGGEDHALAGCFAADDVPAGWKVIGTVRPGSGVTVAGSVWEGNQGWDHFRS